MTLSKPFPKVRLYFRFFGDTFDPDEVTRRLGVEPTSTFRPGDPITPDGQGQRRRPGWILKIDGGETIEIDGLLEEFRRRMDVAPSIVRQVCEELNLEPVITCGVGAEEAGFMPALQLPQDFVRWAAELDAAIDFDVLT